MGELFDQSFIFSLLVSLLLLHLLQTQMQFFPDLFPISFFLLLSLYQCPEILYLLDSSLLNGVVLVHHLVFKGSDGRLQVSHFLFQETLVETILLQHFHVEISFLFQSLHLLLQIRQLSLQPSYLIALLSAYVFQSSRLFPSPV